MCRRRAHGHELFRCRGVNTDGRIELGLGGAAIHCHGHPLDDFPGIRADHVAAQNFIRCVIYDDFHHSPFSPAA